MAKKKEEVQKLAGKTLSLWDKRRNCKKKKKEKRNKIIRKMEDGFIKLTILMVQLGKFFFYLKKELQSTFLFLSSAINKPTAII